MSNITSKWFEATIRYEKTMDDGKQQKVNELYVVDALTFGEAEESITKEMQPYISGEFEVKNINPAAYGEIFFTDKDTDDRWYKAKLAFITKDEDTEKEKRSNVTFLVQAATIDGAIKNIEQEMRGTMVDYVIANISETRIMDVFRHKLAIAPQKEEDDKPEYEEAQ